MPNKSVRFARGFPHDGSRSCLEIFGDNGYQYASNRQERDGIFCVFDLRDRQRAGRGKGLLCFNRCLYSILASVTLSVVLVGLSYVAQGSCPACPASSQGLPTSPIIPGSIIGLSMAAHSSLKSDPSGHLPWAIAKGGVGATCLIVCKLRRAFFYLNANSWPLYNGTYG